jgi:hypothetical protein
MRHFTITALMSAFALCAAGATTAAANVGAHASGAPVMPAKSEAAANSNGKVSADRDKGLDRAEDRRASQSTAKTHHAKSHHHKRHLKHPKLASASSHA